MNNETCKNKAGFTFAEVLITLGIIGIVAAMTLPNLIANYQKKQYVARLQKVYSSLNQGFQNLIVNNGCGGNVDALECTGLFTYNSTDKWTFRDDFEKQIVKILNVVDIQFCDSSNTSRICSHSAKYLSGSTADLVTASNKLAIATLDGYILYLTRLNCNDTPTKNNPKFTKSCTYFWVDTNGYKKPNLAGRDVFQFNITQSGYLIADTSLDYALATNTSYWREVKAQCGEPEKPLGSYKVLGINCAARIMENGWKMDY